MGAPGHERERRKRRRSSEQSPRRRDSFNQRGAQSEIDEDETTNPNQRRRGEDSEGEGTRALRYREIGRNERAERLRRRTPKQTNAPLGAFVLRLKQQMDLVHAGLEDDIPGCGGSRRERTRSKDSLAIDVESAVPGGVELEMVCALVPYDEVHAERNAEPDSLRKRVGRRSIVVDQDRMEIDAASYRGLRQTPRPVNRGGFGPGMDRDLDGLRP